MRKDRRLPPAARLRTQAEQAPDRPAATDERMGTASKSRRTTAAIDLRFGSDQRFGKNGQSRAGDVGARTLNPFCLWLGFVMEPGAPE